MKATGAYIHGTSAEEQARLEAQHRLIGGASFLPPLKSGMRLLDVGSGTGAIAREVAPRIAPGIAVGIDARRGQVEAARRLAREAPRGKTTFMLGRAESLPLRSGLFDIACCRFLLEHVASPAAVVREMARVTTTGGTVVACERRVGCCAETEPDVPAAGVALEALYALQERRGGNPRVAGSLGDLFRAAGLEDVALETRTVILEEPTAVRDYALGGALIVRVAERDLLAEGLIDRRTLDEAYREWREFARTSGAHARYALACARGTRGGRP